MDRQGKNVELFQATQAAQAVFRHYDTDHNGYLDYNETLAFLKEILQVEEESDKTVEKLL